MTASPPNPTPPCRRCEIDPFPSFPNLATPVGMLHTCGRNPAPPPPPDAALPVDVEEALEFLDLAHIGEPVRAHIAALTAQNASLRSEAAALVAERDALREWQKQAADFIQSVYDFRADGPIEDGGLPFGTIDYYTMEDLLNER